LFVFLLFDFVLVRFFLDALASFDHVIKCNAQPVGVRIVVKSTAGGR